MDIRLGIALPLTNDREYSQFWDSFLMMEKPDRFVYLRPEFPGRIDHVRNQLIAEAFETNCSHIIFMDTDQIYPGNTIPKMFETIESCKASVVGTVVYRRYIPFDPLVYNIEEGGLTRIEFEKIYQQEFLKVGAIGCGCVLYDMEVFRVIPKPWFEDKTDSFDKKIEKRGPGEDIGFCYKLKDHGFDIWVNTSLDIGHMSLLNINRGFHRLFLTLQKAVRQNNITSEKEN